MAIRSGVSSFLSDSNIIAELDNDISNSSCYSNESQISTHNKHLRRIFQSESYKELT